MRCGIVPLIALIGAIAPGGARAGSDRSDVLGAEVSRADLRVEAGAIQELPSHALALRHPGVRAVLAARTPQNVELEFRYLGPTRDTQPLASGELRRQIGVKLRAHDTCNVVYVTWHIAPTTGVHVSVKSNPGMSTHAQCGDRGYLNVLPESHREVPLIHEGELHRLGARIEGDQLRVSADGVIVWEGRLPPAAFALDGPVGIRSDNASLDVTIRVGDPDPVPR